MKEKKNNSKFFIFKISKNSEPLNEEQKDKIEKEWYKIICIGFSIVAYVSILIDSNNRIIDELNLFNLIKISFFTIIWSTFTGFIMKIPGYIRNKLK